MGKAVREIDWREAYLWEIHWNLSLASNLTGNDFRTTLNNKFMLTPKANHYIILCLQEKQFTARRNELTGWINKFRSANTYLITQIWNFLLSRKEVCLCLCHLSLSKSSSPEICIFALDDVAAAAAAASRKLQVAAVADMAASNRHLGFGWSSGWGLSFSCLRAARKLWKIFQRIALSHRLQSVATTLAFGFFFLYFCLFLSGFEKFL